MPGEFYIEGKQEKLNLQEILAKLAEILAKLEGPADVEPVTDTTTADWNTAESDVVSVGAADSMHKLHSLLISIHNLVGTVITVRLHMVVNGTERKVYEQTFNAASDPPGLWLVNGTIGIHQALRVTLESNDVADNGQAVDYDYLLEAM
jgi:hypothetical protein